MRKLFVTILTAWLFCACGGSASHPQTEEAQEEQRELDDTHMPKSEAQKFREAQDRLDDMDALMRSYLANKTEKRLMSLVELCDKLYYEYDESKMDKDGRRESMLLQARTDSTRTAVETMLKGELSNMLFPCINENDHLIENVQRWPLYLPKGVTLFYQMSTSGNVTMKIYNADANTTLKTYAGKKKVQDSLQIKNSAVYLIELTPKGASYIDFDVQKRLSDYNQLKQNQTVMVDTVPCSPKDPMAIKVQGIDMKNIFQEPKKLTLRSVGKSFFSGSSRAVVALDVPAGTTEILYSLRISTNEGSSGSDGKFNKKMTEKYRKVKLLGFNVYESTKSRSNLLRELLYGNVPPREEEAYCNVYVFTNPAEAKKFQDNQPVSQLKYNVDLSLMGTQSCNGCIPIKGFKKIYLGFENERFRYSNYLWLEALSVTPKTEYYRIKYRAK